MNGSNRLPRWLLAVAFALLAAVVLGPLGMFVWNLQRQHALQHALDEQENVHVFPAQSHWLSDWLPDSFNNHLPAGKVDLLCLENEGLEQFRNLTGRMDAIRALSFYDCPLTDEDWRTISRERQLEELYLRGPTITAKQLGQLQSLPHLQRLTIEQCPVTDETLVHLANCPSLTHLSLSCTKVTLPAIEAFAAAHPQVVVGWNRITDEEALICDELKSLGLLFWETTPRDRIAEKCHWHIGWSEETILSPRMLEQLQELGPIEQIDLKGRLTSEALKLITSIPTITSVNCLHVSSFDNMEKLASLPQIQTIHELNRTWPDVSEERVQAFFRTHEPKLRSQCYPFSIFNIRE